MLISNTNKLIASSAITTTPVDSSFLADYGKGDSDYLPEPTSKSDPSIQSNQKQQKAKLPIIAGVGLVVGGLGYVIKQKFFK